MRCLLLACAVLGLSGCQGDGVLAGLFKSSRINSAPDEFMVLPTRPLEMPASMSELPSPTPGAPNRVDYQPGAQAIAGLTGRPGVPGNADGRPLVAAAGPVDPTIRQTLAAEDAEWRRVHHGRLLERWIVRDKEVVVYGPMILDAPATYDLLRDRGVQVPAVPPSMLAQ